MELETDRFKDEYDRDSNGFIEADELIFWVSNLYFFHDIEPGG
jgi:Ca2+-binding EF-hand superfamily protein